MGNDKEVSIVFNNEIKNQKQLKEYTEQLKTIKAFASSLDNKTIADVKLAASAIKDVKTKVNTAFNYTTIREFTRALTRAAKTLSSFVTKTSDYLENINLFQVAFDGNYKSADRFIKKMSEMYGLDESWLTRTVGIFKQLSNAMNLSTENGEKLATLMSQMSLDISSLYNIDIDKASSVLQSALAGQTKPIRGATGADITQATLQTTLGNLGIDRTVAELSYAEKRLLIIISLTQQLNESIGDMGRTIESPANQMRVLQQQWERLTRTVGSAFLPILAQILPYLNAILMALTEIVKLIAGLFGYKVEDYDYFSGVADSVLDLEDALGGAASNAGSLKKQLSGLRQFDKLNVITTPSNASGGGGVGGGAGGTGISGDILKAFNDAYDDYQKKLENIKMKAEEIKEKILKTLGFHKELNRETGEWEWKYDGLKTTIKNLWNKFLKLNPTVQILLAYLLKLASFKVINGIKKLIKFFGASGLFTPAKKLASLIKDQLVAGTNLFGDSIGIAVDKWSKSLGFWDKVNTTFVGAAGLYASINLVKDGIKDMATQGEITALSLGETFLGIAGSAGSLAYTLGSYFGKEGAIAGAIIGGLGAIITAYTDYQTYSETNLAQIEELADKYKSVDDAVTNIRDTWEEGKQVSGAYDYYKQLADEMDNIVDKNGNIKQGYEDRAETIASVLSKTLGIEISVTNGIVQGWDKVKDKIFEVIAAKEAEAKLSIAEQAYEKALAEKKNAEQARIDYYHELQTAQTQYLDALLNEKSVSLGYYPELEKHIQDVKDGTMTYGALMTELETKYNDVFYATLDYAAALDEAMNGYEQSDLKLQELNGTIKTYEEMVKYAAEGNTEALNEYFDHESQLIGKSSTERKNYWEDMIGVNKNSLEMLEENRDKYTKAEYDYMKKHYEDQIKLADKKLTQLNNLTVQKAEQVNDDVVKEYKELGENSLDEAVFYLRQLPENVQKTIINKMREKGYKISDELQKGLNDLKPQVTVGVDANTDKFMERIRNMFNNAGTMGTRADGGVLVNGKWMPVKNYASGGLPPVGQMFVARERGPELVGKIGSHTAVMNNDQIVGSVSNGVYNAVRSAMGSVSQSNQVFNIYLDENHKLGTYTLQQLQGMAKTNGKPISIG